MEYTMSEYYNSMQKEELKKLYDRLKRRYDLDNDFEKDMKNPIKNVGGYIYDDKLDNMLRRSNISAYVIIEICADSTSTKRNSFWYSIMACADLDADEYIDSREEVLLEEEKDNVTIEQIYDAIEDAFDELHSSLDDNY